MTLGKSIIFQFCSLTTTVQKLSKNSKFLYCIIGIFYFIVAYKSSGYHHEDEHFQLIEFANYKLGLLKSNQLAWEFDAQIRPGLQPSICYLLFLLFDEFGISDYFTITFLLRLITALFAIIVIREFIKSYNHLINNSLQSYFILASFFICFIPYINVRFSSETWSGLILVTILSLTHKEYRRDSTRKYLVLGLLSGLMVLFRYQSFFFLGGLFLWYILIYKLKFKFLLVSFCSILFVLTLGALIDLWLYGTFTITIFNYFYVNIIKDVASNFGISPWYYYFYTLIKFLPPIGFLTLVSFVFSIVALRKDPIVWSLIPFIAIHCIVPHKEIRFLFPIVNFVPLFIILFIQRTQEVMRIYRSQTLGFTIGSIIIVFFTVANFFGLIAVTILGAGNLKTPVLKLIRNQYQTKDTFITLVATADPFIDIWRPKNTYYNSSGLEINRISTIWQQDFDKLPKLYSTSLIIIKQEDITGPLAVKRIDDYNYTKVYQNVPNFLIIISDFYGIPLKSKNLIVFEKSFNKFEK